MRIGTYSNVKRVNVLMKKVQRRIKEVVPELEISDYSVDGDTTITGEVARQMQMADVNIFMWMGSGLDNSFLQKAVKLLKHYNKTFLVVVDNAEDEEIANGFTTEQIQIVWQYKRYDGEENIFNMLLWLGKTFGRLNTSPLPPKQLPWHGIWHPEWQRNGQDLEGYMASHYVKGRPTVGVLFYRTEWLTGDWTYQDALVRTLESHGLNVIAFFSNSVSDVKTGCPTLQAAMEYYFFRDGRPIVDVIINTMKFSLKTAGVPIKFFQRLNVPVLQAYTVLSSLQEWEDSPAGLDAVNVSISVSLPEFDGIIHTVPVAAKTMDVTGEMVYADMPERMVALADKAYKWAVLGQKSNCDKKIAIIFHNYPATNSSIGSAAGLDSPESVRLLLLSMKHNGYTIDNIPQDSKSFMKLLTDGSTNDRRFLSDESLKTKFQKLSGRDYCEFYNQLPAQVCQRMEQEWGKPPGNVLVDDGALLIPGTMMGNVFVTVQPPRGFGENPGQILHSPDLPPSHHYLGFYYWLKNVWKADGVVHVGTHGSLEWLPGKGTAMSAACYPDIAISSLPNVYPYWVNISGEGIQAKRRSSACLISHLSPPMKLAGAVEGLAELEKMLDEYAHFRFVQPDNLAEIMDMVREQVKKCNLQDEIAEEDDFFDYATKLHVYITDLTNMQIRTGLHTLGCAPVGTELIDYLLMLVRFPHGEAPSFIRFLASISGYDYDELKGNSLHINEAGKSYGQVLDDLELTMHDLVTQLYDSDFAPGTVEELVNKYFPNLLTEDRQILQKILMDICTELVPKLAKTEQEIHNVIEALAGHYIEPSESGAPTVCGDAVLPTGRNFYGVDPRCLPTKAAWLYGKKLGDDLIEQFIREEGRYPEAVGLVLWSGANMRSHGQCIAEYLYLMGVRPVWRDNMQRVCDLEVIPLEELKRPRIDVTGRISGLFRDTMPTAIQWMDKAVKMVCSLAEDYDDNYVLKHIHQDSSWLIEQGEKAETAWEKASYRIFGDPPGAYGAGINNMLDEKNWTSIDDLAQVYIKYSSTAYGADGLPCHPEENVFRRRMSGIDVTVKNEDNRENNMFTTDDHNAYHGGMIATIRSLTGRAPKSYTADSSDSNKLTIRTVEQEGRRLFRAEAMNPKFIDGMKKHGYKGASDLFKYLLHSYQWDATTDLLEDWMYEGFAAKYALDEEMQRWMKDVNPWALYSMSDILLEACQRGMWQAKPETLKALKELFLEMEGELEASADT